MENTLLNAIETFEQGADRTPQLSDERAKALDYYLGRPFGNEVTGRSAVVSRDVADSVEWIKPGLLRVFTSGDEMVQFTPKSSEDIDASQQETDFVNYVITQKNNWFNTAYVWFTDALIQKNGYVKAYWDERIDVEKETYKGITDDQLAIVLQDPEVEVIEHQSYQVPYVQPSQQPGMPPQQVMFPLHTIKVMKKKTYGCVRYVNLPPERVIVSVLHQCIDLDGADFVEHWEWKTLSELRKEGFDVPDDIGDLSGNDSQTENEEQARNRFEENVEIDSESSDPAMRRVKARECWLRFDEDGDGISELRHCLVVGTTILLNEEADLIPIAAITPRIMPHRHTGISVADAVMDIQIIKSSLQRGYLDNVAFAINGRNAVDKNKVNLEDMLTVRPAGVVRTDGPPGDAIMPLTHSANFESVLAGIQYFDVVREERTGSSKQQQLSPDVLKQAPSGIAIAQLMNAGQALVELIARVFAETGVKRLFQIVHALTQKNAVQPEVVRLRNKWVTVDPREWKTRYDMTISVGLGNGNKEQQVGSLQQLVAMQMQLMPTGMTDKKTLRHALTKLTNAYGFKDVDSFWVALDKQMQQPQQQVDPKAIQQAMQQIQQEKQQVDKDKIKLFQDKTKNDVDRIALDADKQFNIEKQATTAAIQNKELIKSGQEQQQNEVNSVKEKVTQQAGSDVANALNQVQATLQNIEAMQQRLMQVEQNQTRILEKEIVGIERVKGKDGRLAGIRRRHANGDVSEVAVN